jgi:hypothetical protein
MSIDDEEVADVPPPKSLISHSKACAIFASWAIQQSPYPVPEELEEAIGYFHDQLINKFAAFGDFPGSWIHVRHDSPFKINEGILYNFLLRMFEDPEFKQTTMWNTARNTDREVSFYRRCILNEEHPDDDFVDLSALARNISMEMWREGGFEEEKREYFAKKSRG